MRNRWKIIPTCIILAFLGLALLPIRSHWVGRIDLQVVFVVLDAETGQPASSAVIELRPDELGFQGEDREVLRHPWEADATGRVVIRCIDCRYSGSRYLMRESFAVLPPFLKFRASASGYVTSKWAYLTNPIYQSAVKRRRRLATMEIKVPLRRTPPDPEPRPDGVTPDGVRGTAPGSSRRPGRGPA